jgi:hypothetical protein
VRECFFQTLRKYETLAIDMLLALACDVITLPLQGWAKKWRDLNGNRPGTGRTATTGGSAGVPV